MSMLVEPLALRTPLAAFNGGLVVEPGHGRASRSARSARSSSRRRSSSSSRPTCPSGCTAAPTGSSATPTARTSRARRTPSSSSPRWSTASTASRAGVAKIVGVSDDYDAVAAAESAAHERARRARLGVALAAVLPRHHPSAGEQGRRGHVPGGALRRSPRTRSRRSATCRTTSSCSRARACRSRWETLTERCSAPRGTSPRRTRTTASRTPSSDSS